MGLVRHEVVARLLIGMDEVNTQLTEYQLPADMHILTTALCEMACTIKKMLVEDWDNESVPPTETQTAV